MKIRDIVNRDVVNISNCEQEPIHIPGSIQPHGFLLGYNPQTRQIEFCSGNVEEYVGLHPSEVLGKRFEELFGEEKREILRSRYDQNEVGVFSPIPIELNGQRFQCVIHLNPEGYPISEFEPDRSDTELVASVYSQTAEFISYLNNTETLRELCDQVARGTRAITGYDRVMVYRFDKEYNGEVFAEACREDLEPFLGLHYPHTDIPVQARELYMRNVLRLIADINYSPVPIYTIDDAPDKNLDLSLSTLRSVSPVHVEYLQNMGVDATMTISLIHQGKLWGLIACHHYSPKVLTPEIRLAALLQGQFIASQIDIRQSNEEYEVSRKIGSALSRLSAYDLPPVIESFQVVAASPDLLKLCNASGVSIIADGRVFTNGSVPPESEILKLSEWLDKHSNSSSFNTEKIINYVPHLKLVCKVAAGIIYHSLGNGNSIIWYRPETLSEVHWAGDPEKAIIKDEKGLHPRNSFRLWKQIVKCRSKEWLQPELNATANFAHNLSRQINILILSREEERYRSLSQTLKEANAELENINWISTHDLQEPLRKIQLIVSRMLLTRDNLDPEVVNELKRIAKSANRMQTLLNDILKYTRISSVDESFETVDLNEIVADVLRESDDVISEAGAEFHVEKLPVIEGISFLIRQLFLNIILNSIKYGAEERPTTVKIWASQADEKTGSCDVIHIADNGIGFDPQYSESIFNIFKRLHSQTEYAGSGIGLALCRKIMKTHGGHIMALGSPGEGAEFRLYFPCSLKNKN